MDADGDAEIVTEEDPSNYQGPAKRPRTSQHGKSLEKLKDLCDHEQTTGTVNTYANWTLKDILRDLQERHLACSSVEYKKELDGAIKHHRQVEKYCEKFLRYVRTAQSSGFSSSSSMRAPGLQFLQDLEKLVHHIEASTSRRVRTAPPSPASPPPQALVSATVPGDNLPYSLAALTW